jgi:hypothetical protein
VSATAQARWLAFWFAPASPVNLAVCRILLFGSLALLYAPVDLHAWGAVSPVFWNPTWSFAVLGLPVLRPAELLILEWTWKLALVGACLGLATRITTAASFLLGFYLLGLPNGFGKIHHYDAIVVFVFAILALSRCGDALSVDRLLARARCASPARPVPASGEYTWPIRMVWLVMALLFFGAGTSKLRTSGLAWIFSDNLAVFLVQAHYHFGNAVPLTSFGLVLAEHRWVCRALAAASVAGEVGYPLALVSRRARAVLVPGVFLLQVGIRALLGPSFVAWMLCNLFWVPWDRVLGLDTRADATDELRDQARAAACRAAS